MISNNTNQRDKQGQCFSLSTGNMMSIAVVNIMGILINSCLAVKDKLEKYEIHGNIKYVEYSYHFRKPGSAKTVGLGECLWLCHHNNIVAEVWNTSIYM